MSPELQILVDRVEVLERQARNWSRSAGLAIRLAAVAIVMSFLGWSAAGRTPASEYGRFSVVEADRFLLRDLNGKVAGGLEGGPDRDGKLVLGGRGGGGAPLPAARCEREGGGGPRGRPRQRREAGAGRPRRARGGIPGS